MMRSGLMAVCLAGALLLPGLAQAQAPAADWLAGDVHVTFASLRNATATGDFAVHQLATSQGTQTAQDIRTQYQQAAAYGQGTLYLAALQDQLRTALQARLASLFPGAQVDVREARIDTASLAPQAGPDAWHPPVRATMAADLSFDLAQMLGAAVTEQVLADALAIGAQAEVPYDLVAPAGYNLTFTFTLPAAIRALDAPGATTSADGGDLTWTLSNWHGASTLAQSVRLKLAARDAPTTWATDAQAQLGVDMHDVQGLTLAGLLAGDYGSLAVHVDAKVLARSLKLDDVPTLAAQVRAKLPAAVDVQGLDADGFRLAVRDGLVSPQTVQQVEAAFRALAEQRLARLTSAPLDLRGGFAPDTLDARWISRPIDGDPPLTYVLQGDLAIPLTTGAQRMNAATMGGPVLLQRSMVFHLPRVEGMDTSYRIGLPPGIELADLQVTHATVTQSRENGRDVAVITPQADDSQATFTFAVTSAFVVMQFWYAIAGLALLAIVVVVGVLLLRRRRRGRRSARMKEFDAAVDASADAALDASPAPPQP